MREAGNEHNQGSMDASPYYNAERDAQLRFDGLATFTNELLGDTPTDPDFEAVLGRLTSGMDAQQRLDFLQRYAEALYSDTPSEPTEQA
ncbi:MAG TPA: hypothetical protein VHT70_02850 [Candidatus Saccharimonadales bacterium]|jgi:hypothetical protein|nr:hypothetical protein [Candidatus Saccharimonadales bacterium]